MGLGNPWEQQLAVACRDMEPWEQLPLLLRAVAREQSPVSGLGAADHAGGLEEVRSLGSPVAAAMRGAQGESGHLISPAPANSLVWDHSSPEGAGQGRFNLHKENYSPLTLLRYI